MTLQLIVQCIIIYSVRLCDIAGVPTKTVDLIFFRLCGVGSLIMINLEKEIREQPGVLSGLEKVNGETVRRALRTSASQLAERATMHPYTLSISSVYMRGCRAVLQRRRSYPNTAQRSSTRIRSLSAFRSRVRLRTCVRSSATQRSAAASPPP